MSKGKDFDIISIGDSTHDTFLELDEASIHCNVDTKRCEICLSWADKIPARHVTQVPGVGNAANAAVSCARLGLRAAIYTNIGDDVIGESITNVFKKEKVDTGFMRVNGHNPSNYSVVLNYGAERTIIVYHQPWSYDLPKNLKAKWFYYTSLGPVHKKIHKQITVQVVKNKIKLAFQPGTHQLREGKKKLTPILKLSEIILLNKEEGQDLTGIKGQNIKKIIDALHRLGPKIVVLTDGQNGAYAGDGTETYFVPIFPLKAKERTGAGDGFSSAFVAALAKGKNIKEALLWGNASSTSVVQYVGAQKGLLDEAGIRKMIKKYKKVKPVKI